jgi:hypothetical protein
MDSKDCNKTRLTSFNKFRFIGMNKHELFKYNTLYQPNFFQIKSFTTKTFVDTAKQSYVKNLDLDYLKNLDLEEYSHSDDELDDTNIKPKNLDELHDANMQSINLDDEICKKSIGTQCDIEDIYDYVEWIFVK